MDDFKDGELRNPFLTNAWSHDNSGSMFRSMLGQNELMTGLMNRQQGMIDQYRGAPKFDANNIKRGIDQGFHRGMASMPSVRSNLKGMGVGAAEGTAALQSSLPMLQARSEAYGDLERDKHQADQSYLMNMANLIAMMNNLGLAGMGNERANLGMISNYALNE